MPDKYRDDRRDEGRTPSGQARPQYDGREARSFGEEGRFSSDQARYYGADTRSYGPRHGPGPAASERQPWRSERYGGRSGEDRGVYGSGYDPGGGYGRDEEHGYRSFDGDVHGGQEYGVSAGGRESLYRQRYAQQSYADNRGDDLGYESRRRDYNRRAAGEDSSFRAGPYGDQPFPHDRGSREFGPPADYAYHPNPDRDLEPDYVAWRDEQLRKHDRDYAGWRAEQHRRYDEDYRSFQGQRREHFGKTFADWRAQREAVAQELDQAPGITNGGESGDKV